MSGSPKSKRYAAREVGLGPHRGCEGTVWYHYSASSTWRACDWCGASSAQGDMVEVEAGLGEPHVIPPEGAPHNNPRMPGALPPPPDLETALMVVREMLDPYNGDRLFDYQRAALFCLLEEVKK